MSKYSYEFKKKVLLEYLAGEGVVVFLARKYGIPSKTRIQEWVEAYQKMGDNGLFRFRQQKKTSIARTISMEILLLNFLMFFLPP